MITAVLGILSALIRLFELLGQSRFQRKEDRRDYETILMLRRYQERLQRAQQARRNVGRGPSLSVDDSPQSDSLPDDGFRRD